MSPSVEDLEDLPLKRRRPLLPSIPPAAVDRSASTWQFSPGDEDQSGFSKPPDPSAFRAPSAQAVTETPSTPSPATKVSTGAGKAMAPGVRMPPPGADLTPNPYLPTSPAMTQGLEPQGGPQGTPAPSAPSSPAPGPQHPQGAPGVQDAISKRTAALEQRLEQGPPQPGQHWYQKLGMALLSMTKLAPMAQQIVHPMWSQQMAQWQGANAADIAGIKSLETAASGESLEEQRRAIAEQRHAQAQDYSAREAERQRATEERERIGRETSWNKQLGIMTKGRESDTMYLPADSPQLPQLRAQNWQLVTPPPEFGIPNTVIAIPPSAIQLDQQTIGLHPSHQIGDIVPWSEHKARQAEEDKARAEIARQQAIAEFNPKPERQEHLDNVGLAIRAVGGDPFNPQSVTPEIARAAAAHLQKTQPGINLTPEAVAFWAQAVAKGVPLPAMGMGSAGAHAREQIINAAPGAAAGVPLIAGRAEQRADTASLQNMVKMHDSVTSFENTAAKNLDVFLNQARRVVDSGSPWINQPLRMISRSGLGGADVAAFDAARQVALAEIAKVVNNPSLSSVLSDSARKEVSGLIPENATLAQIYRVAGVLRQDMANRKGSLEQGIKEIQGRLNPSAQGGGQPGAQGELRVRRKSDGRTGSIPAGNFDPAKYDKIQ